MQDVLLGADVYTRSPPGLMHKRLALQQLRFDLEKVIAYRRDLWKTVGGDHLLVRLLSSFTVPLTLKDDDYVWGIQSNALRVANSFRLTSLWGSGKTWHPGVFYGPQAIEVIVVNADDFDIVAARDDWENLEPISVMSHGLEDFTLPLLDGSGDGITSPGIVVLQINLPMLSFQYKCWWEKFVRNMADRGTETPPRMNLFFQGYPLANLLRSHLDVTLANRTMKTALDVAQDTSDAPSVAQTDPNPFYLNFQTDVVNRLIGEVVDYMRSGRLSFDDWISALPTVSGKDFHDLLTFRELPFVTQVEWAMFVGRLRIMGFLLAFNARGDNARNNQYVNNIRHWVTRMLNGRLFGHGLRGTALRAVLEAVDQTIQPYL